MKKKITILVGLFLFLVVVFAPAKIMESFIPSNSGVQLTGLDGTLWSGSLDSVEINQWELQRVKYQLSFFSLLTGKLAGSAQLEKGDVIGELDFSLSDQKNAEIEDASIHLSAFHFEQFIPFPGIKLRGKVATQDLTVQLVNQRPTQMNGVTRWLNASVTVKGNAFSLGDFSVNWVTKDSGIISGTLDETQTNALKLKGQITLNPNGLMEFKGSVAKTIDRNIYTALMFFADGSAKNGRLPIKFKKKLF